MKSKLIKIMIIIALVLIVLAIGIMLFTKYSNNAGDAVVIDENKKDTSLTTGRIPDGEVLLNNNTVKELTKIFTTYGDEYSNYYKYSMITKLSNKMDTKSKLFFTFYAMDINKEYKNMKCSDVNVQAESDKWSCGFPDTDKTTAFDENKVLEKMKYLFGHNQSIELKEVEFGNQKMMYDVDNKAWILFATGVATKKGEYATTSLEAAYSNEDTLTINITEKLSDDKTQTVALEFIYDEEVNHYVFNKRIVE